MHALQSGSMVWWSRSTAPPAAFRAPVTISSCGAWTIEEGSFRRPHFAPRLRRRWTASIRSGRSFTAVRASPRPTICWRWNTPGWRARNSIPDRGANGRATRSARLKNATRECGSVDAKRGRRGDPFVARAPPVVGHDGIQRLIEILAVAEKRLSQQPFLYGTDLPERGGAAPVPDGGARFEAVHAERLEHEFKDQVGTGLEHAGAPERRPDRKAPLRRRERRLELADLEQ